MRYSRPIALLCICISLVLSPTWSILAAPPRQGRGGPAPIFFDTKNTTLPEYICAADAFASYYTLQQIQVQGLDVQNGFRLGIVPFYLTDPNGQYDVDEAARSELLNRGSWDCLLSTLDSVALQGQGVITAVVDESAGADQIWGRGNIKTLNDLKGKRIAYASASIGQFMALYAMAVGGVRPDRDVTVIEADSVADAVDRFNKGEADVVSGWEPDILAAQQGGGQLIIGSDRLRVAVDVIVTARNAITNRADVVQKFHTAWFQALKNQADAFPAAAQAVADWGHNDWSGIPKATAEADLRKGLSKIAQAPLAANVATMKDTTTLIQRLETARRVWAIAGVRASAVPTKDLVNPQFVLADAQNAALTPTGTPVNNTFLMGNRPKIDAGDASAANTLAVLPCRRFDFLPDSTILTRESRRIIEVCVLPVLESTAGTYLRIIGSSAWPGPIGSFTEQDIRDFALARAVAVRDYLVSKGVDPNRLLVETVLPPNERRNSEDEDVQALDRYVELTLLESGR